MCVAVSMTFSLVSLWNDPTPFETELKYATNLKVSRTIQGNFSWVSIVSMVILSCSYIYHRRWAMFLVNSFEDNII